jgi:hypothetical protein
VPSPAGVKAATAATRGAAEKPAAQLEAVFDDAVAESSIESESALKGLSIK